MIIAFLAAQFWQVLPAQNSRNQALALARRAVRIMQKGQPQGAQQLLEKALQLDPENIHIQYQLALAHYQQKEYQKVCEILDETTRDPEAPMEHFAFLGNAYDNLVDYENASKAYKRGLRKYP
ncbi:MAG: tetratricopeptide repeat protein, partial [Bacteroidota bacterium]